MNLFASLDKLRRHDYGASAERLLKKVSNGLSKAVKASGNYCKTQYQKYIKGPRLAKAEDRAQTAQHEALYEKVEQSKPLPVVNPHKPSVEKTSLKTMPVNARKAVTEDFGLTLEPALSTALNTDNGLHDNASSENVNMNESPFLQEDGSLRLGKTKLSTENSALRGMQNEIRPYELSYITEPLTSREHSITSNGEVTEQEVVDWRNSHQAPVEENVGETSHLTTNEFQNAVDFLASFKGEANRPKYEAAIGSLKESFDLEADASRTELIQAVMQRPLDEMPADLDDNTIAAGHIVLGRDYDLLREAQDGKRFEGNNSKRIDAYCDAVKDEMKSLAQADLIDCDIESRHEQLAYAHSALRDRWNVFDERLQKLFPEQEKDLVR